MKKVLSICLTFLLFSTAYIHAQNVSITGKVVDKEDNQPIPGVSVVVKNTTIGTVTDVDGVYNLSVPENTVSLLFSFVGMKSQEVEIKGQKVIDLTMESESIGMDEVVVTALGIKRESKALGYAVQDVKSEELTKAKNANVVNSISGKVAGVQVTSSSGVAGGSSFVTIRGAASITGNNQPLFVVDGVPINNDQNYSGNPDDGRNNLTGSVGFSKSCN